MAGDGRGWPGVVADVQTRPEIADAWVWMSRGPRRTSRERSKARSACAPRFLSNKISSQNTRKEALILILITNIISLISEHPLKRRATRRARSGSVRRTGSRNRRQGSVRSGSQASNIDRVSSIRRPNGLGRSRRKLEFENDNNTTKSETQKQDLESGDGFLAKPPEKSVKDQIYNILHSGKTILKFIFDRIAEI